MKDRHWRASLILAAATLFTLASVAYFGGYFLLSDSVEVFVVRASRQRCFPHPWQVSIYRPAAKLESLVIGKQVRILVVREPNGNLPRAVPSTY